MFVVFYTANLYICVFMTCYTNCCLHDTLMDPWNVCKYEYVCMYKYGPNPQPDHFSTHDDILLL